MTEQQAQSPIDDLFRKTFEDLPESPAESGWDTPSERVWENIQANISKPNKGWGMQSLVLIAVLVVGMAAGLYWLFSRPTDKPAVTPAVTPIEQPALTPDTSPSSGENQPVVTPKPSKSGVAKDTQSKPSPHNSTEEPKANPANNTAQPLPGSKTTLPPNTTEAQKKKGEGN